MRLLRFAKLAAEAEQLRLRYLARRYAIGAAFAAVALVFGMAALAMAHFAAWLVLAPRLGPAPAALTLAGVDVAVAFVAGLIVLLRAPGAAEREAQALRRMALAEIRPSAVLRQTLTGVVTERVVRILLDRLFGKRRD